MDIWLRNQQAHYRNTFLLTCLVLLLVCNHACAISHNPASVLPANFENYFSTRWFADMAVRSIQYPSSSFAVSRKCVIAFSLEDKIVCLDTEIGVRNWEQPFGPFENVIPAIGHECAVILVDFETLQAVDLTSGRIRWEFTDGTELSPPTIIEDTIFIGSSSGNIYSINETSGKVSWQYNVGSAVIARPAAWKNVVCFGTTSGLLIAYEVSSGRELWAKVLDERIELPIVALKDKFFVLTKRDAVLAFSYKTGNKLWQHLARDVDRPIYPVMDKIIVFGRSKFGDNSFEVLDQSKGERIWRRDFSRKPEDSVCSIDSLLLYIIGENLHIYDNQRGYNLRRLDMPTNVEISGNGQDVFFAIPNEGLWCARINYDGLFEMREQISIFEQETLWGVVKILGFFLVLFLILLVLLIPERGHILPLHEAFLHMRIILIIFIVLVIIDAFAGFLILRHNASAHTGTWSMIYGLSLLLPLPIISFSYGIFGSSVSKKLAVRAGHDQAQGNSTVKAVTELCREMDIHYKVSVVRSAKSEISPFAMPRSLRQCWIVLPAKFQSLLSEACGDSPYLVDALQRLVLSHELAHIKNRDVFALPMVWAIQKPLKWWVVTIVFLHIYVAYLIADPAAALFGRSLVGFNIVGWTFTALSLHFLLKERENLADATATLYVSPQKTSELTRESETGISILERLIFTFTAASTFCRSYLGFSLRSKTVADYFLCKHNTYTAFLKTRIVSFGAELKNRLKLLSSKALFLADKVLPTWKEVLSVAVTIAFVFATLRLVKIFTFVGFMLSQHSPESYGIFGSFLKGMETWPNAPPSRVMWTSFNELLVKLLICFLAAGLLMVPMRKTLARGHRIGIYALGKLLLLILFYYFVFAVFSEFIQEPVTKPPFPWFPGIRLSSNFMFIGVLFGVLSSAIMLATGALEIVSGRRLLILEVMIGLILVLAPAVLLLCIGESLPATSKLFLYICAIVFVRILFLCGFFRPFARYDEVDHERIRYQRLFWRRRFLVLPPWENKNMLSILQTTLVDFFVMWVFPIFLICILAYPYLVKMNVWYFENAGGLHETYLNILETAVDRIKEGTWNVWIALKMMLLGFCDRHVGLDKWFPSTMLCSFVALILLFLAALSMGVVALIGKSRRTNFLAHLPLLTDLSKMLHQDLFTSERKKYFVNNILPKKPYKRPFLSGVERIPLMRSTCEFIAFMSQFKVEDQRYDIMQKWVSECESTQGGFSPKPGLAPNLWHTNAALKMFHEINYVCRTKKELHHKWLEGQLFAKVATEDSFSSRDCLALVECIISSLRYIDAVEKLPHSVVNRILDISVRKWESANRRMVCTYYLVSIFKNLRILSDCDLLGEIRSCWLPPKEQRLILLKPQNRLQETFEIISIVAALYPDTYLDRPSIIQVKDNIVKAFCT